MLLHINPFPVICNYTLNDGNSSVNLILFQWQESFQSLVSSLLTDADTQVRRTLLEFSVAKLCVFFGRQRGNFLSHDNIIFSPYPLYRSI